MDDFQDEKVDQTLDTKICTEVSQVAQEKKTTKPHRVVQKAASEIY